MADAIIDSKRSFQLWGYTVSHRELLLRSTKSADYPTRIDVFFKGVKEFHLPTSFKGLSIAHASLDELRTLPSHRGGWAESGSDLKFFKIGGADFVGYVVALVVFCHEDDGEYCEPSFFDVSRIPGT